MKIREKYCFWSVADGDYARMFETTIRSARSVGVFKDFHVWTDKPIPGAICHRIQPSEKWGCIFKLIYLKHFVKRLNYDYFIWLDTDTYFVRNPGNLLRVLKGSPVHVTLESDICSPVNVRTDWWDCPNQRFVGLMRSQGVTSDSVFNANGGFFIVHHDAVDTFYDLADAFWDYCRNEGFTFVDEPLLAYAMHMLCGNPYLHTIRATSEVWASDWLGVFADRIPDGSPWGFTDYFSGAKIPVNPAIVHAMRSKTALLKPIS